MTTKKVATKPVEKKPVTKKKPVAKTTGVDINHVELESYSMKMVIPTGQYANIQPEITVKAYSVEKAHDFIAPHMNKLWKEYYLINERRPEPVKVPVAPTAKPFVPTPGSESFVPTPGSESSAAPAPITTTTTTATDKVMTYLTDTKPASPDTKPMTVEEICEATGGKVVEDDSLDKIKNMTPDEIFPDTPSPASSVAYNKATQAIESCMSLDALEIIRAQVDKSVKLTQEDKELLQPLLIERFNKISNGF
jgi:hypothetical protein